MKPLHARSILWLSLCGLTACASPLARWEDQQGNAVRAVRAAQVLDPQAAARNGDKLPVHDGKATLESADRYVNSFKEPPPQNIFVIGPAVTGGGGR
jgi:hypothetical protein